MSGKRRDLNIGKKTLQRILLLISPSKGLVFISFLLSFVSTITAIAVPFFVGEAIDCIGDGKDNLWAFLICAGIAVLLSGAFQFLSSRINNRVSNNALAEMRKKAFEKLSNLPISYYDTHAAGDTLSRIISDTETVSDGLLLGFTQLFSGLLTIVITLITMFVMNPVIASVIVLLTPVSVFVAGIIAKRSFSFFQKQAETRSNVTSYLSEAVENLSTVRITGNGSAVCKGFDHVCDCHVKASIDAVFLSALVNPSSRFINSLIYAATAGLGGIFCINGTITVGTLSVFLNYASQYSRPFNEISGVIAELQNALACATRFYELIDEKDMTPDAETSDRRHFYGRVDFENVSFGYPGGKKIYEGFNFHAEPGRKIAIVGPTGCGKTTIINLIMRFYDPDSGKILLDGVDITKISRKKLRSYIGMVLQDTFIFTGTVRDNLCLTENEISDEQMICAAKKCMCHSFIMRLPQGYDTVISESGSALSDGQKQLICICRAMLSDPKVLILDEATSSIDTRTELLVQNAMDELVKGRTSFIVAHRLSTIVNSDVIMVINNGQVAEIGSHRELISLNGIYANIYNSQFSK